MDNKLIESINDLKNQINDKKKVLKELFPKELEKLLLEHKDTLRSINVRINNHEFNDGEATYFGFYHEDMELDFEDALGNRTEYDGHPTKPEYDGVRNKFKKLFKGFDFDDFYEDLFGEHQESVSFALEDGKLNIV